MSVPPNIRALRKYLRNIEEDSHVIPRLAADPASPRDGEAWYNTTSDLFKIRTGGTTVTLGESESVSNGAYLSDVAAPSGDAAATAQGVVYSTNPDDLSALGRDGYTDADGGLVWQPNQAADTPREIVIADAYGPSMWFQRQEMLRQLLDIVGSPFAGAYNGDDSVTLEAYTGGGGAAFDTPDQTTGLPGTLTASGGVFTYSSIDQRSSHGFQMQYTIADSPTKLLIVSSGFLVEAACYQGVYIATGGNGYTAAISGATTGIAAFTSANIASTFYELNFKNAAAGTSLGSTSGGTYNDHLPGTMTANDPNTYGFAALFDCTAQTVDLFGCRYDWGPRWFQFEHQFSDGNDSFTWPAGLTSVARAGFYYATSSGSSVGTILAPLAIYSAA